MVVRSSLLSRPTVVAPTQQAPIVMRLNRTWNIDCPPAKMAIVHGTLVPTPKSAFTLGGRLMLRSKQKRRIAIEIHGPDKDVNNNNNNNNNGGGDSDDRKKKNQKKRVPSPPPQRGLNRADRTLSDAIQLSTELKDDDKIVIRILKPRKMWGFSKEPEDSSDDDSSDEEGEDDVNDDKYMPQKGDPDGWVEYRKYGLDEIFDEEITGRHKNIFEATMGLGASQERRDLKFDNEDQGMY